MRNYFEAILNQARTKILNSNDSTLFSDEFESNILEHYKLVTPSLDKKQTKTQIGQEIMGFHNAPPGVSFSLGSPMEFAMFQVPILGNTELFASITKHHFYSSSTNYLQNRVVIYREFSPNTIAGNDTVIESIKERAKSYFENIEKTLETFQATADDFNNNELKAFISQISLQERDRRSTKSNSEAKLNPFG